MTRREDNIARRRRVIRRRYWYAFKVACPECGAAPDAWCVALALGGGDRAPHVERCRAAPPRPPSPAPLTSSRPAAHVDEEWPDDAEFA